MGERIGVIQIPEFTQKTFIESLEFKFAIDVNLKNIRKIRLFHLRVKKEGLSLSLILVQIEFWEFFLFLSQLNSGKSQVCVQTLLKSLNRRMTI